MSYPVKTISLQKANALSFELEELGLEPAYANGTPLVQMREVLRVLRAFGVTAATSVKTSDFSPGTTSVLVYLRLNIGWMHESMDEFLSDWYAAFEVTERDNIELFHLTAANQGCQ